jgi:hypothetical protein
MSNKMVRGQPIGVNDGLPDILHKSLTAFVLHFYNAAMVPKSDDLLEHADRIPLCEWQRRVLAYHCETISGRYWPVRDPVAWEYVCPASTLLGRPTFLVKFTSRDGSRLVQYDDSEATPITAAQFARNPRFVDELFQSPGWDRNKRVVSARLLVQSCTSCGRRVVIDGVHRLVDIASRETNDADLYVTELSGPQWPRNMPDMSVICVCQTMKQERS